LTCLVPDFACLRAVAESTFFDTCEIGAVAAHTWGSADTTAGDPDFGDPTPCGFQPVNKGELGDGSQAPDLDGTLRLAIGTDITNIDRVKLTARNGEAITPELYSVQGLPERGPTALVLNLKRITGNSTR
jgi:hypothetical protein